MGFRARAGSILSVYLFLFINRVKGLLVITLGYRTYMTISFEHLIEFWEFMTKRKLNEKEY
jgi:hypothetical protein